MPIYNMVIMPVQTWITTAVATLRSTSAYVIFSSRMYHITPVKGHSKGNLFMAHANKSLSDCTDYLPNT